MCSCLRIWVMRSSVKIFIGVLAPLVCMNIADAGNILYIAPLPSPSHHIWNKALSLGLINKGHNITMLTHDTDNSAIKNFHVIRIQGMYEYIQTMYQNTDNDADFEMLDYILLNIKFMYDFVSICCDYDIKSDGLQTLLNYPKDYKFDLIIFDLTVGQCLYPIFERFHNPPVVGVTPFLIPPAFSHAFGNSLYSSYIPHYATEFDDKMNLFDRTSNFIYLYFEMFYRKYFALPDLREIAKKAFGNDVRDLKELERRISLMLSNADPITYYPIAMPPNIIQVGGLHIKPASVLPADLKEIMDKAKHGVILFSLGTNMRSDSLKRAQLGIILETFRKLKETVLWKYESDNLEGLPNNVVLRKWLPQNDILGHPNIKLFISHGGALSTQEATYHGVPVLCIPFFSDQHTNCRLMQEKGVAKHLDKKKLATDDFYETITFILSSSSFRDKMKHLSILYRDQPHTSLDKAVFWVEYVLRHGSADHLGVASRDMPLYKTANLDVVAIFVLGLALIYYAFLLLLTSCRFLFSAKRIKNERTPVSSK